VPDIPVRHAIEFYRFVIPLFVKTHLSFIQNLTVSVGAMMLLAKVSGSLEPRLVTLSDFII